ncbi:MAG: hypothetical protein MSIBF_05970 [Candidatus Altiarchaeales archaeon IMC4]|nr:MAG: hypothetical protein MSIBF_05970 [Candidatus Altiarchaeales archaeon IMC4]
MAIIAVLGPQGTFTEIAADKVFKGAEKEYCETVRGVFDSVASGADFGVVPVENSLEGSVSATMDCLMDYDLNIYGEAVLDINLCLMAPEDTKTEDLKTVKSHPHALAQCREFIGRVIPGAIIIEAASTASAMKDAAAKKDSMAIGQKDAAKIYGLKILKENLQDSPSQTRFIVISKKRNSGNKTSIIFAVSDKPGALYEVLGEFAKAGINLKKIESRPSRRKLGEYVFFVDFEGSLEDRNVKKVLESIKKNTTFVKKLGSYPV